MTAPLHIWLDDIRPMPEGFNIHCKNAFHAIDLLKDCLVARISLDHDLGEPESYYGTGYDVAKYIEKAAFMGHLAKIGVEVHSANAVGIANIRRAIDNANKYWLSRGL